MKVFASTNLIMPLALLWLLLVCPAQAADNGFILLADGSRIEVRDISADRQGNIRCVTPKGRFIIPASMVIDVSIKEPALLRQGARYENSGNLSAALECYRQAADRYRFLGWYAQALTGGAGILLRQGKEEEALSLLQPLLTAPAVGKPSNALLTAYRMGSRLYLKRNNTAAALKLLHLLQGSGNDRFAAWAFKRAGKLYMSQKRYRAAAREFIQAVELCQDKKSQGNEAYQLLLECLGKFDKKLAIFHQKRLKKTDNDSNLQGCVVEGDSK